MRRKQSPDLVVLAGFVAAAFLLGKWQTVARNTGVTDPLSSIARKLVTPVATVLSAAAQMMSDVVVAIGSGTSLKAQNSRLRELSAVAETYTADVERLELEIDELRRLGSWQPRIGKTKVPADVVAYFQLEDRITINVGRSDGVRRGMPVASGGGFVGRVETVDDRSSQVLLVTSTAPESRISALVERTPPNPPPAGLLRGESPNSLRLELADPTATVESGDLVVTSGFSDLVPRGIVIGRIVAVQDDPAFGKRTATVFPRVALGQIREVVVIR